jgi:hypothetical protein
MRIDVSAGVLIGSEAAALEPLKRIVAVSIAVVLLTAGVWRAFVVRDFVRHASVADGQVYAVPHGGSHPAVRFQVPAGELVEYPQGGMIFGYHIGDRVKVLFSPEAPRETACIDSAGALWFDPLLLIVLGLGFGVAGGWTKKGAPR